MKKLEAWFENGIDDEALEAICTILIKHDAKFYVCDEPSSQTEGGKPLIVHGCTFNLNGDCNYPNAEIDKCTKEFCPLFISPSKIVYVDEDGLCYCNCADTCVCDPHKINFALRCTSDQIREAGFTPVYKKRKSGL
jgi:hypothetical protein